MKIIAVVDSEIDNLSIIAELLRTNNFEVFPFLFSNPACIFTQSNEQVIYSIPGIMVSNDLNQTLSWMKEKIGFDPNSILLDRCLFRLGKDQAFFDKVSYMIAQNNHAKFLSCPESGCESLSHEDLEDVVQFVLDL